MPVSGPAPSIESLLRMVHPNLEVDVAMKYLKAVKALRKVGDRYLPRSRRDYIVSTRGSSAQAGHQAQTLGAYLVNLDRNRAPRRRWPSWYDFGAASPFYPVSQLDALKRLIWDQFDTVLKLISEFMYAQEAMRDVNEPTVYVGFNVFEYRYPNSEVSAELAELLQKVHASLASVAGPKSKAWRPPKKMKARH